MTQDSSQHAYKRLQDRPKTAPSGHGASQGRPREDKILQKPMQNQCFWPSRLFAFNGLLRPQDGPKMAQESPKTGPREAQDGSKSVQERPKSGPSGPPEATFRAPTGGPQKVPYAVLIDGLQDGPNRPPRPPEEPQEGPRSLPRTLPRGQNPSKTYGKSMFLTFSPFRFRWALEASRCPQNDPREPQPTPSPWAWRGGFAGSWSVCIGPRWRQEGPRELKMTSKIAQDSPQ